MMKQVKIVPTWEAAAQIYVSALEHGTGAGQHTARDELLRLGRQYDEAVEYIGKLEAAARELTAICIAGGMEVQAIDDICELIGEPE